jgi:hypothetical protein
MRLAGVLSVPGETQTVEARLLNVTPLVLALLTVRQGTLQQWTDPLAGSRERSNSHELSMLHPTRLSLLTSGATPQAAPPPEMGKLVEWYTSQVCVCEVSRELPPCDGAEGVRWLRSSLTRGQALRPVILSHTGSGTEAGIMDQSRARGEPVLSETE